MLRVAAVASAAGIEVAVLGLGVGLELRPLSPRRITPLIGVGAGMFRDIDYPASNHGYYAVNAGFAVRIAGHVKSTLRAQYADSWKSSGFYTVHLGLEVGRSEGLALPSERGVHPLAEHRSQRAREGAGDVIVVSIQDDPVALGRAGRCDAELVVHVDETHS